MGYHSHCMMCRYRAVGRNCPYGSQSETSGLGAALVCAHVKMHYKVVLCVLSNCTLFCVNVDDLFLSFIDHSNNNKKEWEKCKSLFA